MTRAQIDNAYQRISAAKAEIEALREHCPHPNYRIGWFSWRLGSMYPARLCDECDKHLGEPSGDELQAFRDAERECQRAFLIKEYGEQVAEEMMKAMNP